MNSFLNFGLGPDPYPSNIGDQIQWVQFCTLMNPDRALPSLALFVDSVGSYRITYNISRFTGGAITILHLSFLTYSITDYMTLEMISRRIVISIVRCRIQVKILWTPQCNYHALNFIYKKLLL